MQPDIAARLRAAAATLPPGAVPLSHMAQAHGGAAQATLLVLLAAPCMLPIPGVGTLLSMGLIMLATLIWQSQGDLALPQRLARIELPREWAQKVLHLLARFYELAHRLTRPRLSGLVGSMARHWVAPGTLLMALLIFLPIPFGNVLPAVSLMLAGLALAMRDGAAMLAAVGVGLAAVAMSVAVLALGVHVGGEAWQAWQGFREA